MKYFNGKIKHVLSFMLLAIMLIGLTPDRVDAKPFPGVGGGNIPLDDLGKVEIFDRGAVIDNKYTFIPLFGEDSKLTVSGANWKGTRWSSSDPRGFRTFNVFDENFTKDEKGHRRGVDGQRILARYRNVGKFNGKELDVEIRIMDWKSVDGARNAGNISFEIDKIAVSSKGFHWIDMEWTFLEAGTPNPVNVDGYFTVSDIDLYQGVNLSNNLFDSIDGIFVDDSTNAIWYRRPSAYWHQFSTDYGRDVKPDTEYDGDYAFTYTFSNDRMRFQWMTDWSRRDNPKVQYGNRNTAGGEYFIYSDIKQLNRGFAPKKSVNLTKLNHPKDTHKNIVYDVDFNIPSVAETSYFKSLEVKDTVDSILDIQEVGIFDNNSGENVTGMFDVSFNGQTIVAKAKDLALSRTYFYDRSYRMKITSKLNIDALDKIIFDGTGKYEIKNIGYLTIDGDTTETNEVSTLVEGKMIKGIVNHRDISTGQLITSEELEGIPGEPYEVFSRYDLKKGSLSYVPLEPTADRGIMKDGIVITFWYELPQQATTNNGIHIYTNDSGSRQPASIFVSDVISDFRENINSFQSDGELDLWIEDTSNGGTVWSESTTVGRYVGVGEKKITLNNTSIGVGEKTNYRFNIKITEEFEECDEDGCWTYKEVTFDKSLSTHGYKAELPIIKNEDGDVGGNGYVGPLNFGGVVLTEATRSGVEEFWERVTVGSIKQPRLKSGYSYEFNPRIMYSVTGGSDVAWRVQDRVKRPTDAKPRMVIDEKIVDLSDELINEHSDELVNNYSDSLVNKKMKKFTGQDRISFMLDTQPGKDTKRTGGRELRDITYHLPKGYLSREDGRIRYSQDTKSVDAGNKMYVPVWIKELGEYDATLQSTVEIGSHRVVVDIDNIVEIYAYMLSHTDSDTLDYYPDATDSELDELLLHPMNKDDSLFNWSSD